MAVDETARSRGKCGYIKKDGTPCRLTAGAGTPHKGEGCCERHGGNGGRPATSGRYVGHGKYKRYDGLSVARLGELIAEMEADPDPLNILPDLLLARAVIRHFVERADVFESALLAWHGSYSREYQEAVREWHRKNRELPEDEIGDMPDPAGYGKPVKVLDISQVVQFVGILAGVVEKIEKAREKGVIPMTTMRWISHAAASTPIGSVSFRRREGKPDSALSGASRSRHRAAASNTHGARKRAGSSAFSRRRRCPCSPSNG